MHRERIIHPIVTAPFTLGNQWAMDRLTSMRVFRAVVDEGAFARAARRLRLSNAAVSKHVAALEDALNTRLLHRTTRSLGLTPEGSAYYARATVLLELNLMAETLSGQLFVRPSDEEDERRLGAL